MRRIVCKNVNNMRDLGGYCNKEGKVIKFNRFIRSNFPYEMTSQEINYLLNNKINTIIDLRRKDEVARKKNCLDRKEFNYYNISVKSNIFKLEEDIPIGYMKTIEDKETISQVFHIIASSKDGVLFNCKAGKDRTGVIAMILLLLADVYDDDIIADYSVSCIYIRDEIRKMSEDNPDLPLFFGDSKLEYMEETLKLFRQKYKNINNYMEYLGISKEEINLIKHKLFD